MAERVELDKTFWFFLIILIWGLCTIAFLLGIVFAPQLLNIFLKCEMTPS